MQATVPAKVGGVAYAWGNNRYGQLGTGTTATNRCRCSTRPMPVLLPPGVGAEGLDDSGDQFSLIAGWDGNLYASGYNHFGQLGDGSTANSDTPVRVRLPDGVKPRWVQADGSTGMAIGTDDNVYAWGRNQDGQLGDGTTRDSDVPVRVKLPVRVWWYGLALTRNAGFALGDDGNVYAWGANGSGNLGIGRTTHTGCACVSTPVRVHLPAEDGGALVIGAYGGVFAYGSDGNLYTWGPNMHGELGNGTWTTTGCRCVPTPVRVHLPTVFAGLATLAPQGNFGLAVGWNGGVFAWGKDTSGELGDGTVAAHTPCNCVPTPVRVRLPAKFRVASIDADVKSGFALGLGGNVYAWGANGTGQLGDGTTTNSALPVRVRLPAGFRALDFDAEHNIGYAVGKGGSVYRWGGGSDVPTRVQMPDGVKVTGVVESPHNSVLALTDAVPPSSPSPTPTSSPAPAPTIPPPPPPPVVATAPDSPADPWIRDKENDCSCGRQSGQ